MKTDPIEQLARASRGATRLSERAEGLVAETLVLAFSALRLVASQGITVDRAVDLIHQVVDDDLFGLPSPLAIAIAALELNGTPVPYEWITIADG